MHNLLLIGQFATLAGISSRMLRHYDKLGLITPVQIDEISGYRYYANEQLDLLKQIMALQNYGFSLSEIKGIMDRHLTLEEFSSALKDKEILLRQSIDDDTGHLLNIRRTIAYLSENATTPGLSKPIDLDQIMSKRSLKMNMNLSFNQEQLNTLKQKTMRLPNSSLFSEQISDYLSANSDHPKHFITFDLDEFASINDLYGYDTGDVVIYTFINTILEVFNDLIEGGKAIACRYGGDETVIFTSQISHEVIRDQCNAAIAQVRSIDWESLGCPKAMTSSCGIYAFTRSSNIHEPRHMSVKALMEAKRLGKDQVITIEG